MLARLRHLFRTFQYLYYLRFSLTLWLLLPIIGWRDHAHPISLLHGIFTPEKFGQCLGCAFFAVSNGWVALLLARVVCLNGCARFYSPQADSRPAWLMNWLGERSETRSALVLLIAQIPEIFLLGILYANIRHDVLLPNSMVVPKGDLRGFTAGIVIGILVACLFWYVIDVLYYWTYPFRAFNRSARTLLFPRWLLCLGPFLPAADPNHLPDSIEAVPSVANSWPFRPIEWLFRQIAKFGPGYSCQPNAHQPGCACTPGETLWEGHRLLTLGFLGYLAVYFILYPFTAPLKFTVGINIAFIFGVLLLLWVALAFLCTPVENQYPGVHLRKKVGSVAFIVLCSLCILWIVYWNCRQHYPYPPAPPFQFFPVFASVSVLLTFICFALAGLAFFLDRYSVPVLTTAVFLIILVHIPHGGDHFYTAIARNTPGNSLRTPDALFRERCLPDDCSLIVVTATGGGMHAAVWTATVLSSLETAMNAADAKLTQETRKRSDVKPEQSSDKKAKHFHDKLFFASSVSGGSFGVASFLREYKAAEPFPDHYSDRMYQATSCSALEGVAWGLEYADFIHLLVPFFPISGQHDRSNALELVSARNYSETKCNVQNGSSTPGGLSDPKRGYSALTLAQLPPAKDFPAFTFNTTEVETGGRFLLANYANPSRAQSGVYPSQSFLQAYPGWDLNLITAARLSATYPIVSSAARIDHEQFPGVAAHFVDGGYFDNDGIASLVEFLASAFQLDSCAQASSTPNSSQPSGNCLPANLKPRILFIEIRDGADLDMSSSPEAGCPCGVHCKDWGTVDQTKAPLIAFWNTGHESISRRNLREWTILKTALNGRADIQRVVFAFNGNSSYTPLSWHLTPRELSEIRAQIVIDAQSGGPIRDVLTWAGEQGQDIVISPAPQPEPPRTKKWQ